MTGPATVEWLDGFTRVNGGDAGRWATGDVPAPKIVWHTTEGGSVAGAIAALRAKNAWSHLVVDPRTRERVQCVSLARPARALRNTSKPGETGRDRYVYQIEVVGQASRAGDWTDAELAWLGSQVLAPLAAATGTPLTTGVRFYGADAGWTLAVESARQRLSRGEYDGYQGQLGHQHVPENSHWDPGALRMDKIIAAAGGSTKGEPLMVTDADKDAIRKIVREELQPVTLLTTNVVQDVVVADGKGKIGPRLLAACARIESQLAKILAAVTK